MQPRQRGHNLTTVTTRLSRIKQALGRWAMNIRTSKTKKQKGIYTIGRERDEARSRFFDANGRSTWLTLLVLDYVPILRPARQRMPLDS